MVVYVEIEKSLFSRFDKNDVPTNNHIFSHLSL